MEASVPARASYSQVKRHIAFPLDTAGSHNLPSCCAICVPWQSMLNHSVHLGDIRSRRPEQDTCAHHGSEAVTGRSIGRTPTDDGRRPRTRSVAVAPAGNVHEIGHPNVRLDAEDAARGTHATADMSTAPIADALGRREFARTNRST